MTPLGLFHCITIFLNSGETRINYNCPSCHIGAQNNIQTMVPTVNTDSFGVVAFFPFFITAVPYDQQELILPKQKKCYYQKYKPRCP